MKTINIAKVRFNLIFNIPYNDTIRSIKGIKANKYLSNKAKHILGNSVVILQKYQYPIGEAKDRYSICDYNTGATIASGFTAIDIIENTNKRLESLSSPDSYNILKSNYKIINQ